MQRLRLLTALVLGALLGACGGGGGGSGVVAPSHLSYPSPGPYTVGVAAATVGPSYQGDTATFSISPQLPPGLELDANGALGGTPTAESPTTTYTITAANAGGSTSTELSITVNLPPPVISYGSASLVIITGSAVSFAPSNTGGMAKTWSIAAPLPPGLTFSTSTGVISGTATDAAAATSYHISATNSGGTAMTSATLSVTQVLLELGHGTYLEHIAVTPSRALSVDAQDHWVLWNYATGAEVAAGDATCGPITCYGTQTSPFQVADLEGPTYAVQVSGGVELHSVSDGSLLTSIAVTKDSWQLASDGSYLCSATKTSLSAWGLDGHSLVAHAGNYSQAIIWCAPGEIRVARGPLGTNVIETVALPSGVSTTGTLFQGTFASWFTDGESFITATGTTVFVYSKASAQLDARQLGTFDQIGGAGSWFWASSYNTTLSVYAVGASATPALTVATDGSPYASAATLAVRDFSPQNLHVIDLSQSMPVDTLYPQSLGIVAYGASSAQQWLAGTGSGVLIDGPSLAGTPRYFNYGAPNALAGGATSLALATATNQTLLYDPSSWSQTGLIGDLAGLNVAQLSLSADGSVLAARGSGGSNAFVRTYQLPGASQIHGWDYPQPGLLQPLDTSLSGDGSTLAQVLQDSTGPLAYRSQVSPANGSAPVWSAVVAPAINATIPWQPVRLSPDGTRWTTSNGVESDATTSIYANAALETVVDGWAAAWLSNDSLLQLEYVSVMGNPYVYQDARLYNAAGMNQGTVPLPQAFAGVGSQPLQVLGPDSVYEPASNTVWTVSTGTPSWVGPPVIYPFVGAVAGGEVVFQYRHQLLRQPL